MLVHILKHSLVDSYMCPDRGSNPQPWRIGTLLQPTELPGQGCTAKVLNEHEMKENEANCPNSNSAHRENYFE